MQIAILDPFAGISGDMLLGALIDSGLDPEWLHGLPARMGFPTVGVHIEKVDRCSVTCTKVSFQIEGDTGHDHHHGDHGHHGSHIGDLVKLVEQADLRPGVKAKAVKAFGLLGEAEGRVHGVAPEKVHLHEVGATDALLDIVGGIGGFAELGIDKIYNLPVALGNGWVQAAHGNLPVPAPATAFILEGVAVRTDGPLVGEATTPTGAALLRILSDGSPPNNWRSTGMGWGAGTRNPDGYPNALRLLLADSATEAGSVEIIATDIDDLVPEYLEPLREAVFAAGALDCSIWPTHGKKGRIGVRIEVVATADTADRVIQALFTHSTTVGIRRVTALRNTLERREQIVELAGGNRVRIKVWEGPTGVRFKPEYADVKAAAEALGRPALEIAQEAEHCARAIVRNGGGADRESKTRS